MILRRMKLPGFTAGYLLQAHSSLERINPRTVAYVHARVRLTRSQCLLVLTMKQPAVPPPNSPTWVMIGGIVMVLCAFGFVVSSLL